MRTHEGQSRGFGFCVFHSPSVFRAVLNTRNHMIDNRRVGTYWFPLIILGRCLALSKDEAPPPQSSERLVIA